MWIKIFARFHSFASVCLSSERFNVLPVIGRGWIVKTSKQTFSQLNTKRLRRSYELSESRQVLLIRPKYLGDKNEFKWNCLIPLELISLFYWHSSLMYTSVVEAQQQIRLVVRRSSQAEQSGSFGCGFRLNRIGSLDELHLIIPSTAQQPVTESQ